MAELSKEERDELENQLALILLLIWATNDSRGWATMPYSTQHFRDLLNKNGAPDVVRKIITRSEENFRAEVGATNTTLPTKIVDAQVDRYLDQLSNRLVNRQKDHIDKVEQQKVEARRSLTPADFPQEDILPYSDADARAESATSVTDIVSTTEDVAAESVQKETKTTLQAFWFTEPGACPICRPLHGKGKSTWARKFPKGPPAHPNCVLPDTMVSSLIGFNGGTCAPYRGNVRKLWFGDGTYLMLTEGHLLPTNRGLVAACQMEVGDVCYMVNQLRITNRESVSTSVGFHSLPAYEVFERFHSFANCKRESKVVADSAFHGDGVRMLGETEILWLNEQPRPVDDGMRLLESFISENMHVIHLDRVTDIDVLWYHGPVYDFEGVSLPYYIANGVIVHNCRCHLEWLPVIN